MSALDDTLKRHRKRVIDREERTFRELLQAYEVIEQELRFSLRQLEEKVRAAQEAGEEISPSWFSRQGRLRSLIDQVKSQIERFGGTASGITAREQRAALTIAADHVRETVQLISPANAATVGTLLNPKIVEDAVGMMGDGSPILEYYREQLAPKVAEMIRTEVIKAAATGTDFATIARRLMETGQITRQRALTVARTEVGRVRRETTQRIYQENSDVITGWEWVAAKSPRTCVVCLAQDGKIFPLDQVFPQHINCRCTLIPVIAGVERPKRTIGKEWFDRQSDEVKAKIIGVDGLAAYKEGLVTLDDFVGWKPDKQFGLSVYTKPLSKILADKPVSEPVIRTPRNITVDFAPGTKETLETLLRRELSNDEVGGLVGALDGAKVNVDFDFDSETEGLRFNVRHPLISEQIRTLGEDWSGRVKMHNDYFRKSLTAPPSTGLKSFATQAFHAQKFGVEFIDTYAAGDYRQSKMKAGFNGYYTWARFGYNALLTPSDLAKFPPGWQKLDDLNDLLDQPNGWFVWKYFGSARDMLFELEDGSSSWRLLKKYLQKRKFTIDFD